MPRPSAQDLQMGARALDSRNLLGRSARALTVIVQELVNEINMSHNHASTAVSLQLQLIERLSAFSGVQMRREAEAAV